MRQREQYQCPQKYTRIDPRHSSIGEPFTTRAADASARQVLKKDGPFFSFFCFGLLAPAAAGSGGADGFSGEIAGVSK